MSQVMPTDAQERKGVPLARALLDYFPAALAEVAKLSVQGNIQHSGNANDIHWDRAKSSDHADCIIRHLIDRDTLDTDGMRHSAKVAWRALALLQEELEAAGAKPGRASRFANTEYDIYEGVAEEDRSAASWLSCAALTSATAQVYNNLVENTQHYGNIEENKFKPGEEYYCSTYDEVVTILYACHPHARYDWLVSDEEGFQYPVREDELQVLRGS